MELIQKFLPLVYLLASVLFIVGIKMMNRVQTARKGNFLSAFGMFIAVFTTVIEIGKTDFTIIIAGLVVGSLVGIVLAYKVQMTQMPEMVALLNGFGGLASSLVALSILWVEVVQRNEGLSLVELMGTDVALTVPLSIFIGALTFSGSVVAFLKLSGQWTKSRLMAQQQWINLLVFIVIVFLSLTMALYVSTDWLNGLLGWIIFLLSNLVGIFLITPIGGADMPVVISLLNSYSGLAASATGFVLGNQILIVTGALVGASGIILSNLMCKAMNRSLYNVCFGGMGTETSNIGSADYKNVKSCSVEEAALMLESIQSLVIVPGYGMAVAQAQHSIKNLADMVQKRGARVRYAIHPVAGRMPGHMNILLAEASVPYDQLVEMDNINPDFKNTDIVLVVGANDIVNSAAISDVKSPIYGMPVLNVHEAQSVIVMKRSLGAGFAGIKNPLFEHERTVMLYGDAKEVLDQLLKELKSL